MNLFFSKITTRREKIKEIFSGFKHQIVGMICTKPGFESYRKLIESIGLESARETNKNDYFKNIQKVFENIDKNYIENLINNIP